MENQRCNTPTIVSWIAFIISVISVGCVFFKSSNPPEISILIAAFGVMVTLLVAWQIWQTIDAKNSIQEIKKEFNRLKRDRNRDLDNNKHLSRAYNLLAKAIDIKHNKIETKLCSSGYIETAYALYEFLLAKLETNSYEVNCCMIDLGKYLDALSSSTDAKNSFINDKNEIDEISEKIVGHVQLKIKHATDFAKALNDLKKKRQQLTGV